METLPVVFTSESDAAKLEKVRDEVHQRTQASLGAQDAYIEGLHYLRDRKPEAAVQSFDLSLEYAKKVQDSADLQCVILRNQAEAFEMCKQENRALDCLEAALQLKPQDPVLWYRLGRGVLRLYKLNAGRQALQNCLLLSPDFTPALKGLCQVHLIEWNLVELGLCASKLLEIEPENGVAAALISLATKRGAAGKSGLAQRLLEERSKRIQHMRNVLSEGRVFPQAVYKFGGNHEPEGMGMFLIQVISEGRNSSVIPLVSKTGDQGLPAASELFERVVESLLHTVRSFPEDEVFALLDNGSSDTQMDLEIHTRETASTLTPKMTDSAEQRNQCSDAKEVVSTATASADTLAQEEPDPKRQKTADASAPANSTHEHDVIAEKVDSAPSDAISNGSGDDVHLVKEVRAEGKDDKASDEAKQEKARRSKRDRAAVTRNDVGPGKGEHNALSELEQIVPSCASVLSEIAVALRRPCGDSTNDSESGGMHPFFEIPVSRSVVSSDDLVGEGVSENTHAGSRILADLAAIFRKSDSARVRAGCAHAEKDVSLATLQLGRLVTEFVFLVASKKEYRLFSWTSRSVLCMAELCARIYRLCPLSDFAPSSAAEKLTSRSASTVLSSIYSLGPRNMAVAVFILELLVELIGGNLAKDVPVWSQKAVATVAVLVGVAEDQERGDIIPLRPGLVESEDAGLYLRAHFASIRLATTTSSIPGPRMQQLYQELDAKISKYLQGRVISLGHCPSTRVLSGDSVSSFIPTISAQTIMDDADRRIGSKKTAIERRIASRQVFFSLLRTIYSPQGVSGASVSYSMQIPIIEKLLKCLVHYSNPWWHLVLETRLVMQKLCAAAGSKPAGGKSKSSIVLDYLLVTVPSLLIGFVSGFKQASEMDYKVLPPTAVRQSALRSIFAVTVRFFISLGMFGGRPDENLVAAARIPQGGEEFDKAFLRIRKQTRNVGPAVSVMSSSLLCVLAADAHSRGVIDMGNKLSGTVGSRFATMHKVLSKVAAASKGKHDLSLAGSLVTSFLPVTFRNGGMESALVQALGLICLDIEWRQLSNQAAGSQKKVADISQRIVTDCLVVLFHCFLRQNTHFRSLFLDVLVANQQLFVRPVSSQRGHYLADDFAMPSMTFYAAARHGFGQLSVTTGNEKAYGPMSQHPLLRICAVSVAALVHPENAERRLHPAAFAQWRDLGDTTVDTKKAFTSLKFGKSIICLFDDLSRFMAGENIPGPAAAKLDSMVTGQTAGSEQGAGYSMFELARDIPQRRRPSDYAGLISGVPPWLGCVCSRFWRMLKASVHNANRSPDYYYIAANRTRWALGYYPTDMSLWRSLFSQRVQDYLGMAARIRAVSSAGCWPWENVGACSFLSLEHPKASEMRHVYTEYLQPAFMEILASFSILGAWVADEKYVAEATGLMSHLVYHHQAYVQSLFTSLRGESKVLDSAALSTAALVDTKWPKMFRANSKPFVVAGLVRLVRPLHQFVPSCGLPGDDVMSVLQRAADLGMFVPVLLALMETVYGNSLEALGIYVRSDRALPPNEVSPIDSHLQLVLVLADKMYASLKEQIDRHFSPDSLNCNPFAIYVTCYLYFLGGLVSSALKHQGNTTRFEADTLFSKGVDTFDQFWPRLSVRRSLLTEWKDILRVRSRKTWISMAEPRAEVKPVDAIISSARFIAQAFRVDDEFFALHSHISTLYSLSQNCVILYVMLMLRRSKYHMDRASKGAGGKSDLGEDDLQAEVDVLRVIVTRAKQVVVGSLTPSKADVQFLGISMCLLIEMCQNFFLEWPSEVSVSTIRVVIDLCRKSVADGGAQMGPAAERLSIAGISSPQRVVDFLGQVVLQMEEEQRIGSPPKVVST